jgi:hypothetical protein
MWANIYDHLNGVHFSATAKYLVDVAGLFVKNYLLV